MKQFCDDKSALHSIPHFKMFWALLVLFPLVSSCTSLSDQFADTASTAQTLTAQYEKNNKNNKVAAKNGMVPGPSDDSLQTDLGKKEDSSKKENDRQYGQAYDDSNERQAVSNSDNQPKSLLSMFSNKKSRVEGEVAVEPVNEVNDSKSDKETVKANATNGVSTTQSNNKSESEKPKSLLALFSNKQNNDKQMGDVGDVNNGATNGAVNARTSSKNLAGRTDSQDEGARQRLFSGKSDFAFNDGEIGVSNRLASMKPGRVDRSQYSGELPGVRPNGGIEIKHRTSLYDDTDIDANEVEAFPSIQMASVGGLGRDLPNGLRLAHKAVDARCLKPQLINLLKTIERNYNRPVYITSGYRSPIYNRKVNGANRSLHMSCAAADIIVPGVHKYEVAKFVRSLPGRGGVGTYCHQAIHVDVGPRRDWNWSCGAKK